MTEQELERAIEEGRVTMQLGQPSRRGPFSSDFVVHPTRESRNGAMAATGEVVDLEVVRAVHKRRPVYRLMTMHLDFAGGGYLSVYEVSFDCPGSGVPDGPANDR